MYRVQVYGTPQQKGSTRMVPVKGRLVVTSDNPRLKAWERAVLVAARVAVCGARLVPPPVALDVEFRLPLTASIRRALQRRGPGDIRLGDLPHTTTPDLDKLVRGVCDPLSGVLYQDDKQIARLRATKRYARLDEVPGALLLIYPLTPTQVKGGS